MIHRRAAAAIDVQLFEHVQAAGVHDLLDQPANDCLVALGHEALPLPRAGQATLRGAYMITLAPQGEGQPKLAARAVPRAPVITYVP